MVLERIRNQRLHFITGKGGVGKSTVAAALALALARSGKRTLLLETDTYSAMEELLGFRSTGLAPTLVERNLWASNLLSEDCFMATLRRFVPSDRIVKAIVTNRVAEAFFKAAPSVNEVTVLDQVRVFYDDMEGQRPRFDHIVVDLPASGHAVTFLNVPATMNRMMRGLGPLAKMTGVVEEIVKDPARSTIIAVCLPEEMPVNETIELAQQLRQVLGRSLTLALVNMLHPPVLDPEQLAVARRVHEGPMSSGVASRRLLEGAELAQGWHDRDHKYLGVLRERLSDLVVSLPVFAEMSGDVVARKLAAHFAEPPAL